LAAFDPVPLWLGLLQSRPSATTAFAWVITEIVKRP
jgi:hypothetical protein